ncbi:PASTA domain-containing protein [Luedemannella flava]
MVVERPDAEIAAGTAIGTEPGAGSFVEKGSEITLFISSGPPEDPPTEEPSESPEGPTEEPTG